MSKGICVVTGGSRGIGRAIVHGMAADGYEVVATGRDEQALAETVAGADGTVTAALLDVSNPAAVSEFFAGRTVDVLVNSAGVASSAPVHRTTLAEWERILRVNATGPFLCTRAVVEGMRSRDRGRIVMVASLASHVGSPYTAAYTASKHAVIGLMRVVAAELAATGVTANAVCPAYVDTPMTRQTIETIERVAGLDEDSALARLTGMVPLGRLLDPGEVASAVSFLAGAGSGAINGQTIVLDGGGVQR